MIYGYIRVNTNKQDCENKKLGIEKKAEQLGVRIDKYIEDAEVSGTKEPDKRALGGCLRHLKSDDVIASSMAPDLVSDSPSWRLLLFNVHFGF